MNTRTKHVRETLLLALFIACGATYAAAQQHQHGAGGGQTAGGRAGCPMGGGMMMMGGGKHADGAASCPMMDMHAHGDVAIEDTKTGVTIRVTAKKPEDVPQIQKHAHRMAQCMSPAEPTPAAPAAPAAPAPKAR